MQILPPHNDGLPVQYLAAGVLTGVIMANLGLLASVLILAGLTIAAYCRGYRITLTKHDPWDRQ